MNMLNSPATKIRRLMKSYNSEQIIKSPTYYTEHSSSLIDLFFVKNMEHICTAFVADPFIPDLTRFHSGKKHNSQKGENNITLCEKFKQIRNNVTTEIRKSKQKYMDRLVNKI